MSTISNALPASVAKGRVFDQEPTGRVQGLDLAEDPHGEAVPLPPLRRDEVLLQGLDELPQFLVARVKSSRVALSEEDILFEQQI